MLLLPGLHRLDDLVLDVCDKVVDPLATSVEHLDDLLDWDLSSIRFDSVPGRDALKDDLLCPLGCVGSDLILPLLNEPSRH